MVHCCCIGSTIALRDVGPELTARFDLANVVTGEPSRLAVERALPPASVLLPRHQDHVALAERQLVLVVLLEVEAGLHHLLPAPAVLRHLLSRHTHRSLSYWRRRTDRAKRGRTVPLIWIVFAGSPWIWRRRASAQTWTD